MKLILFRYHDDRDYDNDDSKYRRRSPRYD